MSDERIETVANCHGSKMAGYLVQYMFELTKEESDSLRSHFASLKKRGTHSKYTLSAFTEHGIPQLSNCNQSKNVEVVFFIRNKMLDFVNRFVYICV